MNNTATFPLHGAWMAPNMPNPLIRLTSGRIYTQVVTGKRGHSLATTPPRGGYFAVRGPNPPTILPVGWYEIWGFFGIRAGKLRGEPQGGGMGTGLSGPVSGVAKAGRGI
jgi:hypothetical protein